MNRSIEFVWVYLVYVYVHHFNVQVLINNSIGWFVYFINYSRIFCNH